MDYQQYLDEINALNDYFRLGVAVLLTLVALFLAKYAVIRPWWKFVTSTEADWDDHIYTAPSPIERTHSFWPLALS